MKRKIITSLLVVSFILATFHFSLHNQFNHKHDSSCTIYVLEQMLSGSDALEITPFIALFTPFTSPLFEQNSLFVSTEKYFHIRAPPPIFL